MSNPLQVPASPRRPGAKSLPLNISSNNKSNNNTSKIITPTITSKPINSLGSNSSASSGSSNNSRTLNSPTISSTPLLGSQSPKMSLTQGPKTATQLPSLGSAYAVAAGGHNSFNNVSISGSIPIPLDSTTNLVSTVVNNSCTVIG